MKTTLCYAVPVLRSTPASERLKVCIPEFTGFQLFSCGTITSTSYTYIFCAEKTPIDYKILKEWIENMK
jgi:hypothetical protein